MFEMTSMSLITWLYWQDALRVILSKITRFCVIKDVILRMISISDYCLIPWKTVRCLRPDEHIHLFNDHQSFSFLLSIVHLRFLFWLEFQPNIFLSICIACPIIKKTRHTLTITNGILQTMAQLVCHAFVFKHHDHSNLISLTHFLSGSKKTFNQSHVGQPKCYRVNVDRKFQPILKMVVTFTRARDGPHGPNNLELQSMSIFYCILPFYWRQLQRLSRYSIFSSFKVWMYLVLVWQYNNCHNTQG